VSGVTDYDTQDWARRRRIEDLLVRVESEFLATPDLRLTISEAGRRFEADELTCEAVLDALVDAAVLFKTRDRVYGRLLPNLKAA